MGEGKFSTGDAAFNPEELTQVTTPLVDMEQAMVKRTSECPSVVAYEISRDQLPGVRWSNLIV